MREKSLGQALSEKGYINSINCRKCGTPLGFTDEDIKFAEGRKLDKLEWEFQGYIECPFCGTQTLVKVDVANIKNRWNIAKYYTTYRGN